MKPKFIFYFLFLFLPSLSMSLHGAEKDMLHPKSIELLSNGMTWMKDSPFSEEQESWKVSVETHFPKIIPQEKERS